jgi:orotate phosphoribosyltransferase
MCEAIADRFTITVKNDQTITTEPPLIDTVIGPAPNGAILASRVAEDIEDLTRRATFAVYAEKDPYELDDEGKPVFVIRSTFQRFVDQLQTVLIVEDVINSGRTVRKIIGLVNEYGGSVYGVAALWNRGHQTAESLGVPHLYALANRQYDVYPLADCPLCRKRLPINLELGKGKEFKDQHPDYVGGYVWVD